MEKDYNIEFCHLYADEDFGEEQIKSIHVLKEKMPEGIFED